MAPTMSWSEAEHDPRVSESCGETGRFAQDTTTQRVPSWICATGIQQTAGNLEDGFPQRLKGLLLQLGDEALLEKKHRDGVWTRGFHAQVLRVWVGRSQDSAPRLCTAISTL